MLRLKLRGAWEPEDFIEVFQGIESLYYKAAMRHVYAEPYLHRPSFRWLEQPFRQSFSFDDYYLDEANNRFLSQARMSAPALVRLKVVRIEYASPGTVDLLGLGEVLKALADIVGRIIMFFSERELRWERTAQARLDTTLKETEFDQEQENLRTLKLENARRILEIKREFGVWPQDLELLLAVNDQDKLIPRIAEGKLIGIEVKVKDT